MVKVNWDREKQTIDQRRRFLIRMDRFATEMKSFVLLERKILKGITAKIHIFELKQEAANGK